MFTPSRFLDVYTKSGCISFAFPPLYPIGKFPWQTLEWTHQRRSEYGDEKKKIPVPLENWASVVQPAVTSDIYLASAHDT